jgi:hypothetical protein
MKRNGISRFRNAVALAALSLLAIGCAHEPELASSDTSAAESSSTAAASTASPDSGDATALDEETQAMLTSDPDGQAKASESAAAVTSNENAASAPDTVSADGTNNDTANSTTMAPAPLVDPVAPAPVPAPPSASKPADVAAPAATAAAPAPAPVAASTQPKAAPKKLAHATRTAPNLNRYYFLRNGDTPEFLSKLFYGSPAKADKLVQWNKPRESWQPGKLIYYQSAEQPHQHKMLSFYDEKAVPSEDYVTKPGDSLAKFAQERYGSSLSAREIAAANDLQKDAPLALNRTLHLYPSMLSKETQVAQAAPSAPPAKSDADMIRQEIEKVERDNAKTQAQAQAKDTVAQSAAPVSPSVQQPAPIQMPNPVVPEQTKASLASMEVTNLVRQNPIVIAGVGALLVLLGTYFMAARRRTRSRLDF